MSSLHRVLNCLSFLHLFEGVAGEGASNESGVVVNGDFRFFRSLYLRTFTFKATIIIIYYVSPYRLFIDTETYDLE